MVPASLTRPAVGSIGRAEGVATRVAWRPANVPFAVSAELRALMVWGVLLGLLGVSILLGYVWVRLKVVEVGYRLSATRQLVERMELEGRDLAVRAAAADAAGRLQELARERLGMRPPQAGEEDALP
jgi:cell division protein FtsL